MPTLLRSLAFAVAFFASPTRSPLWQVAAAVPVDREPQALSELEQDQYSDLVAELTRRAVADDAIGDLVPVARAQGLELTDSAEHIRLMPGTAETSDMGVLVLRRGPLAAEAVVSVQGPQTDSEVGLLAAQLFEESPFRAILLSTRGAPERSLADAQPLASWTLDQVLPEAWFVQVSTHVGDMHSPLLVVDGGDAGTRRVDLELAADRLCVALGGASVVSSRTAPLYAQRQNAQGKALRGSARFLLVSVRADVVDDLTRDRALGRAIGGVVLHIADPTRDRQRWLPGQRLEPAT